MEKPPVSKRPANHKGVTFVAEWHHIETGKTTMHRSPAEFRSDLERLYKAGFRPVTARDWLAGKMDLPKGASPVVMTFDDANPSQFQLKDDGTVDPNCGVGIWLDFAKTHPDFPVKGTFYVLPTMWAQPKWVAKKLEMLREWGSEVGNHTIEHVPLRHQTDERVKKEVGDAVLALEKLGEKGPFSLAYPLGSTPKNLSLLKGFDWKGQKIVTSAGFLVGANPASGPSSPKFDPYRIPRIQATKGVCGLDYWLDELKKGHVKLYVE
ncbi:hypothetical protein EON82_09640 [bacterium]|nr:MAG: hypothetical protein EON82_09640 [bacterium]